MIPQYAKISTGTEGIHTLMFCSFHYALLSALPRRAESEKKDLEPVHKKDSSEEFHNFLSD